MKYIKYFGNAAAVGSGVEVDLPNVSYLEAKNVLFVPGNSGTATVKVNGSGNIEAETGPTYEYVDLGLPSGTLWAKCNVGAQTETDYGLYFAWGETTGYPYQSTAKGFDWSDYAWVTGVTPGQEVSESNLTKYTSSDGKTVLDLSDDAARVNMGGNWRMPSQAQLEELITGTTNSWVTINGVAGRKFQNKTDSSKYIFIPAAGYGDGGEWDEAGDSNSIWSRSLVSDNVLYATFMLCFNDNVRVDNDLRFCGYSVRGVIDGSN